MDSLISVVIPVYNVERYLSKCLESIYKQSYRNLEIILVDDGATDQCPKICDEYARMDKRAVVIHKKNGGLSDARNVGIQNAKGKYLVLIDSDDYVSENYIEYLYNLLIKDNVDMSICQINNTDEVGIPWKNQAQYQDCLVNGNEKCMYAFFTNPAIGAEACRKLYKLELFRDIQYPVGKYHEDMYTTYLLISKCSRVSIGKEQYYY